MESKLYRILAKCFEKIGLVELGCLMIWMAVLCEAEVAND